MVVDKDPAVTSRAGLKQSRLKDPDKAAVMSATGLETINPDKETDQGTVRAIGLAMETTTVLDMAATTTATLTTTTLR